MAVAGVILLEFLCVAGEGVSEVSRGGEGTITKFVDTGLVVCRHSQGMTNALNGPACSQSAGAIISECISAATFQNPDSSDAVWKFLEEARRQQWGNMSDPARDQFFWTGKPGAEFGVVERSTTGSISANAAYSTEKTMNRVAEEMGEENEDEAEESCPDTTKKRPKKLNSAGLLPGGRDPSTGNIVQPPPETFLLLLLIPHQVRYLRLTDNFAQTDTLVEQRGVDDNEEQNRVDHTGIRALTASSLGVVAPQLQWIAQRVNP